MIQFPAHVLRYIHVYIKSALGAYVKPPIRPRSYSKSDAKLRVQLCKIRHYVLPYTHRMGISCLCQPQIPAACVDTSDNKPILYAT